MRWDDLFSQLDAQVDGLEREARDAEIADLTRSRRGAVEWLDRCQGRDLELTVLAVGSVRGRVETVAASWLLVRSDAFDWVVDAGAVLGVRGAGWPGRHSRGEVARRLSWSTAWRVLSRDRTQTRVVRIDGSVVEGVAVDVGRDHVGIQAYEGGRPVPRQLPLLVPYRAIAAVRYARIPA